MSFGGTENANTKKSMQRELFLADVEKIVPWNGLANEVERPIHVIKRQFRLKVSFRGLARNILHLFALSSLWMARKRLLETTGELHCYVRVTRRARAAHQPRQRKTRGLSSFRVPLVAQRQQEALNSATRLAFPAVLGIAVAVVTMPISDSAVA